MIRSLYVLGISTVLAASGIFGLSVWQWCGGDSGREELLRAPSAVRMFIESAGERKGDGAGEVPPLVAQAEILAAFLNPPPSAKEKTPEVAPVEQGKGEVAEAAPVVRPVAASVKFKLHGTSYYPNLPDRSMSLISEAGYDAGEEHWVKEGSHLGHFVIHEIRKGMIVYRDGEQLREMTVEHGATVPSLVRDMQSGSRKISGDINISSTAQPIPAGPNSVEIAGGN